MILDFEENSVIQRLDSRMKIVIATLFTILLAMSQNFIVLLLGLCLAILLIKLSYLSIKRIKIRLLTLNLFNILLLLILPFSVNDPIGTFDFSHNGLWQATVITIKSNSILLIFTALLGTIERMTLGYALYALKLPPKLVHLLLFMIRYLDVLEQEYLKLRRAMIVRGFYPQTNWHTYRSLAYLIGLLLIRSLDRSERILAAMKCRGFSGQFFILKQFSLQCSDKVFCGISLGLFLGLLGIEWLNS